MTVVVCCGSPNSRFREIGNLLHAAGVKAPIPSEADGLSPTAWQAQLLTANRLSNTTKAGEYLADIDDSTTQQAQKIVEANQHQGIWGWSDAESSLYLEFWKTLDPTFVFILSYSSPQEELAFHMQNIDHDGKCDNALETWLNYNARLLHFYNRHRKCTLLVNDKRCLAKPVELYDACRSRWNLVLEESNCATPGRNRKLSAIPTLLSGALVKARDDVVSLNYEIEATASLNASALHDTNVRDAWVEYRELADAAYSHTKEVARLEKLADDYEKQEVLRQQIQEALIQSQQEAEDCTLELNQKEAQIEELRTTVKALKESDRGDQAETAEAIRHLEASESARDELTKENELLYLQLGQVQEELEHYFELHSRRKIEQGAARQDHARIRIPLDGPINGENWHQVETNALGQYRWTGPGLRASLLFTVDRSEVKLLVIEYLDVLTAKQLQGLRIYIDGSDVSFQFYDRLVPKFILAEMCDRKTASGGETEIVLDLPETICPSDIDRHSPDHRKLGIAVSAVSVVPTRPDLHLSRGLPLAHRLKQSIRLGRSKLLPDRFPLSHFDGIAYLHAHPEVAEAVAKGKLPSAIAHYVTSGYRKGLRFPLAVSNAPSEGSRADLKKLTGHYGQPESLLP